MITKTTRGTLRRPSVILSGDDEVIEVEGSHNKIITRAVAATAKTPLEL